MWAGLILVVVFGAAVGPLTAPAGLFDEPLTRMVAENQLELTGSHCGVDLRSGAGVLLNDWVPLLCEEATREQRRCLIRLLLEACPAPATVRARGTGS
jgi:hypothetical protein